MASKIANRFTENPGIFDQRMSECFVCRLEDHAAEMHALGYVKHDHDS